MLRGRTWSLLLLLLGGLALAYALQNAFGPTKRTVPYSELVTALEDDRVREVWIGAAAVEAKVVPEEGTGSDGDAKTETWSAQRVPGFDPDALIEELETRDVTYSGRPESEPWWLLLFWLIPLALIMLPTLLIGRGLRGGAGGGPGSASPMSFGRNKAKLYDESAQIRVGFDDVAGVDEAKGELTEVVDFLRSPGRYQQLGAQIPRGVLLVGPPGTGKTLLARAVAGEAGTPFFSITASSFVEMFVGVGAARVRDLFKQAKERAPCIVFIDEIDAIGRSRGGLGAMGTNDEREQTLNQLLAELDGFESDSQVVIMAATNRPEMLDAALTRAGRFDRQVVVDRPDVQARHAILKVHAKKIALSDQVDLELVAKRTPGMVGADMARVVNEAALAAARRGSERVEQADFEEAVDRIQLGLKKRNRAMNQTELERIAVHESGHALVAMGSEHADPVHRVSIIPRTIGALGVTLQLPTEDRHLMTRGELADRIAVMMGGRVAEELVFEEVSTGAQNDLERATETARQMVCRFGMSERLGAQTFGKPAGLRFLDTPVSFSEERNFSDHRAREIDLEVSNILQAGVSQAREILQSRRKVLDAMTSTLLEKETLDREDLDALCSNEERADSA
ncbi:MAG TPA: ATP-dependent zinc metalloprotease FtsH [Myxococcales bacterium LLY-WYZ-16_1]|nr:ATP-dependent zinc metalloprotease FtsH [Myxococcales bacterium LLY-WYZ-16_1]